MKLLRGSRSVLVGCAVAFGLLGCSNNPTAPASGASPDVATETRSLLPASAADVKAHDRPNAVFRTVPAADAEGVVRGNFPLTVQFNNCQSRPANEDDNLKFTYDFNGDGLVDEYGHCRWDHVYEDNATARVCVSDRRPDNEICQTWQIQGGRPKENRLTVSFTIDSVNCGATQPFEFFLNGVAIGSAMSTAPCTCFAATNVGTYAFDSDTVAASWKKGAANTIRFVNNDVFIAAAAVAYVNVQVTRTDGKTFSSCIDADGISPCTGLTACTPGPYWVGPDDVSTVIVDH